MFACPDNLQGRLKTIRSDGLLLFGNVYSLLLTLVPPGKQVAQNRSRYRVPNAGNGGGNGRLGIAGEKFSTQTGGKSGVLYADLDGKGAFFSGIHAGQRTAVIAEDVAADVVCSDGKYHHEGGFGETMAMNGCNTADDAGKRDNGNGRHNRAHVFKPVFFMQRDIGDRADNDR